MAEHAEQKPGRDRQLTAVLALITTATACAMFVLATPRAIVPVELPPLVLDADRVEKAIAADAALAERAPGGLDVDELHARYLEEGVAERGGVEEMGDVKARQYGTRALAARVFARVGPAGVNALRASGVADFLRALRGETQDEHEIAGALGDFPQLLKDYGLIDAEGHTLAPELSLRAMAKARWNLIHGLPVGEGLSPIEVQAFEGYIALHAATAPSGRRAEAASAFHKAGGKRSAQAHATWLFHGGRVKEAVSMMESAHALRPALSTRNYLIGMTAPAL